MIEFEKGKKYTLLCALISLLVHTFPTNAAPVGQRDRRTVQNRRADDGQGGVPTSLYHANITTSSRLSSGSEGPLLPASIPSTALVPSESPVALSSATSIAEALHTSLAPTASLTPPSVSFSNLVVNGTTDLTIVPVATTTANSTLAVAPEVFVKNASMLSTSASNSSAQALSRPDESSQSAAPRNASTPTIAQANANTVSTTASRVNSTLRVFAQTLGSDWVTPKTTPTIKPAMKGSVCTTLQREGHSHVVPFPTTVISATTATIRPTTLDRTIFSTTLDRTSSPTALDRTSSPTTLDRTSSPTTLDRTTSPTTLDQAASPTTLDQTASRALEDTTPTGTDIFVPIATDPAPYMVGPRGGHPVARVGIAASIAAPIDTNKFYAGLLLGDQTDTVWTHPYSIRWVKGADNIKSWGMAVTHTERSHVTYGPGDPTQYYINPVGIDSLVFSAEELGSTTVLTTDSHKAFSVNANLAPSAGAAPLLTMPLVQGMGFATAIYSSGTPLIQSGVLFKALSPLSVSNGISKTTATLQDGTQWAIYVIPNEPTPSIKLVLEDSQTLQISGGFKGIVQIAKLGGGDSAKDVYDSSAGAYAVAGAVSGTIVSKDTISVTGTTTASYSLSWIKHGDISKTLIMFALPHHIQSLDQATAASQTNITLQTTTKGIATGLLADSFTMIEKLASNMAFAPYNPSSGSVTKLPAAAVSLIAQTAAEELGEDISAQTNLDTMYFSGKALAKFAAIIYTAHDLANDPGIAAAGLVKLEAAFNVFVQNHQKNPLVYDTVWKGAVSSAGYKDIQADYGGTAYNDHHFHYGYFVYTAAVITYLDPAWIQNNQNKAWVNMLVRDYANSATNDAYYPFSRSFDWYHGHSWAKGLFQSSSGKDEESSSEDSFASYAVKMWGKVSGDGNMEARGDLMLAIQARSFSNYFLMESTNKNQPANFIDNKVTGILFEDKIDHTTYFGTKTEYIEGIHMLPLMPNSGLTRSRNFVREEWAKYFDNSRVNAVTDGWRGILMANLAFIDARTSWNFFADRNFDPAHLDGGASRTWYLALAAALGGVD